MSRLNYRIDSSDQSSNYSTGLPVPAYIALYVDANSVGVPYARIYENATTPGGFVAMSPGYQYIVSGLTPDKTYVVEYKDDNGTRILLKTLITSIANRCFDSHLVYNGNNLIFKVDNGGISFSTQYLYDGSFDLSMQVSIDGGGTFKTFTNSSVTPHSYAGHTGWTNDELAALGLSTSIASVILRVVVENCNKTKGLLFSFEAPPPCDIAWGSPAYTKTNCTSNGADDGTITLINVTSSYFIQYSLDDITFQSSNVFTGLSPGTYTGYVRDTNPSACAHLTVSGITITEPPASACDLVYGGTIKTNETGIGLNNGTAIISATSSFSPEVSINGSTWFAAPHTFTGIAPGTYTIHLRDSNPTGCNFNPGTFEILAFGTAITGTMIGNWLNRYNFIQFREFNGIKEFNTVDRGCEGVEDQLPQPFRLRDEAFAFEKNERHYPVICPNEVFTFYFNFILNDPDWSSYKIAIANYQGIQLDNIGTIQKVDLDSTHYNIYSDDCQVSGLPIGIYFLVLYKVDTLLYASNEIQLLTLNNTDKFFNAKYVTVRAQWKNLNRIYGYLWDLIPSFALKIRLKLYVIDTQPEGTFEQYSEVSTGVKRNDNVELSKYYVMQLYYGDDIANEAMYVFQISTTIVLNNVTYITKSGYKITYDPRMQVNVGQIEFYDQEFSSINKGGRPGGIIPVPDGGFLEGDFDGLIKL